MYRQIARMVIFGLLVTIVFSSCIRKPDLLPIRRAEGIGIEGFCKRDATLRLVVTVRNQGGNMATSAGSVKVTVEFLPGGQFSKNINGIPAGGESDVPFDIPAGCFNPDCGFSITVDPDNTIDESNEVNNRADGICIG